jgi:superfamily I DNA/RNA helicase
MRVLQSVQPSPEQLPIVLEDRPGIAVLRGAAGSGKTTTALLRLKQLCRARVARQERLQHSRPVRVLVLTYNRSLAGYIAALAQEQVADAARLDLTVSTFASWAQDLLGHIPILDDDDRKAILRRLGTHLGLDLTFLDGEVHYALGRFQSDDIERYLERDRDGRGTMPRVDKARMLNDVLLPYVGYKRQHDLSDWHDLAEQVGTLDSEQYDVLIIDEGQDFTASQLRAVLAHQAADASVTFVLDTVQRIYPSFFTWAEVGLDARRFVLNTRLTENRRNTRQIAAFARPFVAGLNIDENGQLPDLDSASSDGPMPIVFGGGFARQAAVIIEHLQTLDLSDANVGILHPLGGGWFDALRGYLSRAGIRYVELAKNRDWPAGPINVGLCTLHSAKGLEFDHVIICGVTSQTAFAPDDESDTATQNLRRLLAMAFGRAKSSLLLCHDPTKPADVLRYLDPSTYTEWGLST